MRFLELFALLGAVQGALLFTLIIMRYRHPKNGALAALVFVFSIRLGTIPSWSYDRLVEFPALLPLTTPLPFLFGPLLWWYVRELRGEVQGRPRHPWIHFLPYVADVLVLTAFVFISSPLQFQEYATQVFAGSPPVTFLLRNGAKVFLNLTYVGVAGRIAFGSISKFVAPSRRLWMRSLVSVSGVVLLLFGYVALNPTATAQLSVGVVIPFLVLALAMAGLIYTVSLLVILFPELPSRGIVSDETGSRSSDESILPERQPLCSDEECGRIVERLEERLRDGAFQDPDFSLSDAAHQLHVTPNRLSFAINHVGHSPFRRLINQYRLEFVVRKIDQGYLENHSILDLAMEAGFPAKSTFNRVFKEEFQVSPSEYAEEAEVTGRHRSNE
jgi:AraC-like DNA-binding protein